MDDLINARKDSITDPRSLNDIKRKATQFGMSISDIMDGGFKKINSNAQDKHNHLFIKPGHRRSQSDNTHVEYKLSESKRERSHYFNHSHRKYIN